MRTSAFLSLAVVTVAASLALGTAQARTVQQQVSADPRGAVDVSDVSGRIEIIGWDNPQVSVTANLERDSQRLEVKSDRGRTSVRVTHGPGGFVDGGGDVRLVVHVPRESEVNASSVSADIASSSVTGAQHLQSVSGEIDAELGAGTNEVKSVSGAIHLRGSGAGSGSLRVTDVSGEVKVSKLAGDLEATTISGDLDAQVAAAHSVRVHTTSGDLELNAGLERDGTIEAETVSGDQHIAASAPAGFQYEVRTFSGEINDCFGQRSERTSEYGPGRRLDGARGAGNGHVRIKSLSGDVSLCDH